MSKSSTINLQLCLVAGLMAGIVGAGIAMASIDQLAPLSEPLTQHLKYWGLGLLALVGWQTDGWLHYLKFMHDLSAAGHPYAILLRMIGVATSGALAFVLVSWRLSKS